MTQYRILRGGDHLAEQLLFREAVADEAFKSGSPYLSLGFRGFRPWFLAVEEPVIHLTLPHYTFDERVR